MRLPSRWCFVVCMWWCVHVKSPSFRCCVSLCVAHATLSFGLYFSLYLYLFNSLSLSHFGVLYVCVWRVCVGRGNGQNPPAQRTHHL